MAELKSFITSYKVTGHKFIPFIPEDAKSSSYAPLDMDSERSIKINTEGVTSLLKASFLVFIRYVFALVRFNRVFLAKSILFVSELVNNQTFHSFMDSYASCRSKPFAMECGGVLHELDQKVVYMQMQFYVLIGSFVYNIIIKIYRFLV
jgi:hypothetical protein